MHRNSKTRMKNDGVKFKIIGRKGCLTLFAFLVLVGAFIIYFGISKYYSTRTDDPDEIFHRPQTAAPIVKLNNAINRAKEFYVNEYLLKSLSTVEQGKVFILFSEDGKTREVDADYIPIQREKVEVFDKYVEYQLYIVIHFLMYFQDWGYNINDPLVERAKEWLITTFDARKGRWVWSEQGCLHSKAIIALVRLGEKENAKKAMDWALKSNLKVGDGFAELQSDAVIHSVSKHALTHFQAKDIIQNKSDHSKLSMEGTAKFLYAMAALDMVDTADFQKAKNQLEQSYSENIALDSFVENFGEVTAVSWIVHAYEDHQLTKDNLYDKAKAFVIALAEKDLSENFLMNYSRGKIFTALSLMRDEKVYSLRKNILKIILDRQFPDGSWEPNGSVANKQPQDWDESRVYADGFLLNYKGGRGSTTKTILEALVIFKKSSRATNF